jgi:Big-like domain-containing protein/fibronectin type III domain protein
MQFSLRKLRLVISVIGFVTACTLIQCLSVFAQSVNLAWDPKTDSGLAGYKIYQGTSSRNYSTSINVGNVTSYTVAGLNSGTYYFAVTAYYTSGTETGFSNEVSTTVTTTTTDSTPPSITLTSPANGSSISGTVTLIASVSDNIGVVGVQFIVDGVNLGSEDPGEPFSDPWDTATVSNGAHTLTARARDAAGNQTISSPITVNVSNTAAGTTLLPAPINVSVK